MEPFMELPGPERAFRAATQASKPLRRQDAVDAERRLARRVEGTEKGWTRHDLDGRV